MKAGETQILTLLNGNLQFVLPIYQRTYSWGEPQCLRLWEDVLRIGREANNPGHFLGSIVYIQADVIEFPIPAELLVIDGQQRLTTLSLLLAATGREIEARGGGYQVSAAFIGDSYLYNPHRPGEEKYKLLLTQNDRETLKAVLDDRPLPTPASKKVVANYDLFRSLLADPGIDIAAVFRGIGKLMVVSISLDRNYDNPQLIFESLNSTGLALTQADLIRNYVLMGLPLAEQERLYRDYWHPMEAAFGDDDYARLFDRFMRDYLTVRTGQIPRISEVYAAFRDYLRGRPSGAVESVLADLSRYSEHFVALVRASHPDRAVRTAMADINELEVAVAYPFLLELWEDQASGKLTTQELAEALRLVESYVFRRSVCGIPTNTLNRTFAGLAGQLDKSDYLKTLKVQFCLLDSYRRMPDDAEFRRELLVKDMYNIRRPKYWLRRLENMSRKEPADVGELTVEHILPQNPSLSTQWQADLGANWQAIRQEYLHTIGNLTLTGYNAPNGDRPFLVKRDLTDEHGQRVGFAGSPLHLNQDLAKRDRWDETAIQERAGRLADLALHAWPYPDVTEVTLLEGRASLGATEGERRWYDSEKLRPILQALSERVLSLGPGISTTRNKRYVAFKLGDRHIVDVWGNWRFMWMTINVPYGEISDPQGITIDWSGSRHHGRGDVYVRVYPTDDLGPVLELVRQSYERALGVG